MIVFDLRCGAGHVFEAWFGSSGDYEAQGARGLISCPICGNGDIVKAAMAPAVPLKSNQRTERGQKKANSGRAGSASNGPDSDGAVSGSSVSVSDAMPSATEVKAMLSALAAAQAQIEANCDYVGDRFAATARAIHDGEASARGIYGEATRAEAAALLDDGIAIAPLPFRSRRTSDA